MTLAEIAELRAELWRAGYRAVPLLSHGDPDRARAGKAPIGRRWIEDACRNPPRSAVEPALAHLTNTGLLCGFEGPTAVDVDIDVPVIAGLIEDLALAHFGPTAVRRRSNSSRVALLYGSDPVDPSCWRRIAGAFGQIEIIGTGGHQVAGYGTHSTGVRLFWAPIGPLDIHLAQLPKISGRQVRVFLNLCAPIIGMEARQHRPDGLDGVGAAPTEAAVSDAGLARIASALATIPSDDYFTWIKVGGAIFTITQGSSDGFTLWDAWSARSRKYQRDEMRLRWHSFRERRASRAGFGTIIHLARLCGWKQPEAEVPPAWLAAHPPADAIPSAPSPARGRTA